ncbi:MAG: tetratricopeptide repeat protein [Deltaproteobacteria bacterium]|nr:tetratricopeptide repeat protein [Deltaproteobacteria bacterium]
MSYPILFMRNRYLIFSAILLLFIIAFYPLCLRLISQLYYLRAVNYAGEEQYGLAVYHFEKAIHYRDNDPLIWTELGEAYHNLGMSGPADKLIPIVKKAKKAYLEAARLNPLDVEAAYGLAREETVLELTHPDRYHLQKTNPYDAYPYYQQTIRLRPNGITYHYAMTNYLYGVGRIGEFLKVLRNLARIHPPAYGYLKKEVFWSYTAKEAVKKGLRQAIEQEVSLRQAHMAMSSLLTDEKDWAGAVFHYKNALAHQTIENNSDNYLRLGRLYLENRQVQEAEECFLNALSMSRTRERDLKGLYGIYKRKGYLEELYEFYDQASRRFPLSGRMDILLARTLVDLNRHHQAKRILNELNREGPVAEAHYRLARIAEKEKDWDSMELFIQKATVLDPSNSGYHMIFSRVLKRKKKLDRAEKEAGLAIEYSAKPSSGLFNYRAGLRWTKKDYNGAIEDWVSAISLEPKRASYYGRAADASYRLGQWSQAMDYYQAAMHLDPKNKNYRKRHDEIKAMN